jgi:glycosyltransferase involved in cell wall biosynthesis
LRVLHVSPSVARSDGGPAEVIRGLVPALVDIGVDVTVEATSKGIGLQDADVVAASNINIHPMVGHSSVTYSSELATAIARTVAEYDVVHIHGLQSHVGSAAMRAARRAHVPYVIEPHGALNRYHWQQHRLRKRMWAASADKRNWKELAGVVYSSTSEAIQGGDVMKHVASYTIPLGVDESLFSVARPAKSTDSVPVVAYVGRITRKKRLDLLLDALVEPGLSDVDLKVVVAGRADGTLGIDPSRYVEMLGVSDRVSLVGSIDARERLELLSRASVFVLPSEDESFGVAVAEAMAAGAAVVTSNAVGLAEEAEAAGALVVADLDPGSFAKAINQALSDKSLGESARAYAKSNFTWKAAATASKLMYEDVIRRARSLP